jgi:hypothetical protein
VVIKEKQLPKATLFPLCEIRSSKVPLSLKSVIVQKKQKCDKPTDVNDMKLEPLASRPMGSSVAVNE